jgi:tetratricopeptide (TPR) repeat protein
MAADRRFARRMCTALLLLLAGAPSRTAAQQRAVTFNRDIAPLVFEHCASCHRPDGGAPFSLLTYGDVRQRAALIVDAVRRRYMPPWQPEPGFGAFAHERRLSEGEMRLFERWREAGVPEGAGDEPPVPPSMAGRWRRGTPDLVVTMAAPYVLAESGGDVFRTVVLPVPLTSARLVKGLELVSSAPRAVHHANIKIDRTRSSRRLDAESAGPGFEGGAGRDARFPDGHFLGWTPGQQPQSFDAGAWTLTPGSDLVVELHMTPTGRPEPVTISIGLQFTDRPPARTPYMLRLGSQRIDIPAGAAGYLSSDRYVLPVEVEVVAIQPHAHNLAREVEALARLPDGSIRWLLKISDWDFRWQDVYHYIEPVRLPAGTTLMTSYRYDNSAGNPRNRSQPPKRVTFGQTTASEMGDVWLQVVTADAAARAALDRDYGPKMLQEDINGVETALQTAPDDPHLHADLALCYLEARRTGEALVHLQRAVSLAPGLASAHYDLGTLLLNEQRFDEARPHFVEAARLQPDFSEAHNNLGVVHFLEGRLDQALAAYRAAIRADAGNAEAHFNLGRTLLATGQGDEAEREYRQALQIAPADAEANSALASLLSSRGLTEAAVAYYRRALASQPDLTSALADLAWILATTTRLDLRRPAEAVALAERAARLTGHQHAAVLDTLAAACFAAGDLRRAIETATAAASVARAGGDTESAKRIEERLAVYRGAAMTGR